MAIAKISPIKKVAADSQTLQGSLARSGYTRSPGTVKMLTPHMEPNGDYRTGLDVNALYIKQLERINPEAAEVERNIVRDMAAKAKDESHLDLNPRSEYYSKIFGPKMGTPQVARLVKMSAESPFTLDLDNPYDLITYAWLRVHPTIAPSYAAYKEGRVKNSNNVDFFVDDDSQEAEYAYKEKSDVNKAIAKNEGMTEARRLKVATLLKLKVNYNSKPHIIYNAIDEYIKKSSHKEKTVDLFNKVYSLSDEQLTVEHTIAEAFYLNIYRDKNFRVMEGEVEVAKNKEDLMDKLMNPINQDELIALQEKVRQSKARQI